MAALANSTNKYPIRAKQNSSTNLPEVLSGHELVGPAFSLKVDWFPGKDNGNSTSPRSALVETMTFQQGCRSHQIKTP